MQVSQTLYGLSAILTLRNEFKTVIVRGVRITPTRQAAVQQHFPNIEGFRHAA
ncbi:MAG: hypothetical protein P8R36_06320 [Actinomycetota bacterium]|nr:hypothetical protein [Actinomycetota bacterium]MDG1489885.1 hypothetical protein [Actinomycetota bacterium]